MGAVVQVRGGGEWAEGVSSSLGFTCHKNRFMVSVLPLLENVICLYLKVRLCLFPVRGFDKGPGLLDAKVGKRSISGKSPTHIQPE